MRAIPLGRLATGGLLLLPGALVVYFGFNAGGFFPGSTGAVAAGLALILALRVTLASDPFEGFSPGLAVAGVALGLFALWTLASGAWSGSESRALLEFNRVLVYLLALVLFGLIGRTPARIRLAIWGLAGGIAVVAMAAFVSRTLPDVLAAGTSVYDARLGYPLTYWNALGVLMSIGIVLCLNMTASASEPRAARVVSASALPLLTATLLFTFSRGAIGVAVIGMVLCVVLSRDRALLAALLATAPAVVMAVLSAYDADILATRSYSSAAGMSQGRHVAVVVGVCVLGAGALRAVLLVLDVRMRPVKVHRWAARVAGVGLLVAALILVLALDVPDRVSTQYDRFTKGNTLQQPAKARDRLTEVGNNGRLEQWDVALGSFRSEWIRGEGAGTYQLQWAKDRPRTFVVNDAHSLYLEVAGELGLVGGVLLLVALVCIVGALGLRVRGDQRALFAAPLAACLIWALHAGVDWDWEMPAVTAWLFALGGLALARESGRSPRLRAGRTVRLAIALGLLVVAVAPAAVALSQNRLNDSVRAFKRQECDRAIDAGLASIKFAPMRPEPFQIIGFCNARRGFGPLSIKFMRRATERDPENWEFHYSLAVVQAAAGQDPRRAAASALRLNRDEPLTKNGVRRFDTGDPRKWRKRARSAPLPFQSAESP